MACDPGKFEKIAQTTRFGVKPLVLSKRDLLPVRYCFSDDVLQSTTRSADDSDDTLVTGEKDDSQVPEEKTVFPNTESKEDSVPAADADVPDKSRRKDDKKDKSTDEKDKKNEKKKKEKHKCRRHSKKSSPRRVQTSDSELSDVSSLSDDDDGSVSRSVSQQSDNSDRKATQRQQQRSSRSRSRSQSPSALSDHEMRKKELFTRLFTERHKKHSQTAESKEKKKKVDKNGNELGDRSRSSEADYRAPAGRKSQQRRSETDRHHAEQSGRRSRPSAVEKREMATSQGSARGKTRDNRLQSGVFQELERIYGAPVTSSSAGGGGGGGRPRSRTDSQQQQQRASRAAKHGRSSAQHRRYSPADETAEDLGRVSVRK